MSRLRIPALRVAALVTSVVLVSVLGCGDDSGLGKRYPVSGAVRLNGAPLEKGRIDFHPTDPAKGRAASGEIQNGSYRLTTLTTGDGALPGQYKVTVTAMEVDNSKVLETVKKYGGGGRQHEIAKAAAAGKMLVPAKYTLADTSGLTATVEEKSNSIDFELKEP